MLTQLSGAYHLRQGHAQTCNVEMKAEAAPELTSSAHHKNIKKIPKWQQVNDEE